MSDTGPMTADQSDQTAPQRFRHLPAAVDPDSTVASQPSSSVAADIEAERDFYARGQG